MNHLRNFVIAAILMIAFNTEAKNDPSNDPSTNDITSSISGQVSDQKTGEALAGVMITVEGTKIKVYSDLDGKFKISSIQPGSYDLVLTLISYNNSLVEDLKLKANEEEIIVVKLNNNN